MMSVQSQQREPMTTPGVCCQSVTTYSILSYRDSKPPLENGHCRDRLNSHKDERDRLYSHKDESIRLYSQKRQSDRLYSQDVQTGDNASVVSEVT